MPVDPTATSSYTGVNRRPRRLAIFAQADGVFSSIWILSALILAFFWTVAASAETHGGDEWSTSQQGSAPIRLITPTATPSPPAQPQAPSCSATRGSIREKEISITGQVRDLPFRVYLPPCYDQDRQERYPTLYFLHGLLGDDKQWEEAGALEQADALLSSGVIPPFIIVMPWERTGIDLEPALVNGLIPYIDQAFRTRAESSWRAIGGLSRGGGQALQIGLKHPDLFGQISMHSPAILNADGPILTWLRAIPEEMQPALWIDIGQRDSLYPSTVHLIEVLFNNGYAATTQLNTGDHDMAYWRAHVDTYLRWHAGLWFGHLLRDYAALRSH